MPAGLLRAEADKRRGLLLACKGSLSALFVLAGWLTPAGAWCVLAGAVFFYFSDLDVARDRFVSPGFVNRLLGQPLYYAGQFLLAWSTGMTA